MPRKKIQTVQEDNKPATYLDFEKIPDCLRMTPEGVDKIIAGKVDRIQEYFQEYGIKKGVIGLSGGIDSAVAAALAARAIGPENIIAVRLPCKERQKEITESEKIAYDVAKAIGIPEKNIQTINIERPTTESWNTATLSLARKNPQYRLSDWELQYGNMAARMRMIMLEQVCSLVGGIIIGTENKTEHLLAYYTIGGDNISGIEPFLDLWKVQIYQLAARLGLPESVLMRKPTAELWDGQTDEGELGIDYVTIDTILWFVWQNTSGGDDLADLLEVQLNISKKKYNKVINHVISKQGKREAPYIVPSIPI